MLPWTRRATSMRGGVDAEGVRHWRPDDKRKVLVAMELNQVS